MTSPDIRRTGRARRTAAFCVVLALAAGLPLAPFAAAENGTAEAWHALDAGEMRDRFVGFKIEGVYNNGEAFSEELKADMTTFYRDQNSETPGEYELRDEFICFAYPVPIDTGCFRVWQRSANCYDMYIAEGQGFPAVGYYQRMVGIGWDSRFWRSDEEPTCPGNQLAGRPGGGATLT